MSPAQTSGPSSVTLAGLELPKEARVYVYILDLPHSRLDS